MKRKKKRASFSPCLRQRCQGAMPRLMPSRAQRQLLVAHCMIWLVTAGRPRPIPMASERPFQRQWRQLLEPLPPSATKSIASLLIFHPIMHSAGGTRPNSARHLLALFSAKNILRTKRPSLPNRWPTLSSAPALDGCLRRLCSFGSRVVAKQALFMASMPARLTSATESNKEIQNERHSSILPFTQ